MQVSLESLTGWIADVRITRHGLQHKETGHQVPLDPATLGDMLRWVQYDRALRKIPSRLGDPVRICFTPTRARPWYFARAIVDHLGAEIVDRPEDADVVWAFEDATISEPLVAPDGTITINASCNDVSKTMIGEAYFKVYGDSLSVDPEAFFGPMAVKSEVNGAHDGRIVEGPVPREPGLVYQRLIDNRIEGGLVEDLRTTIMGGRPVLVFRKQRPVSDRFANSNAKVHLADLGDVFSDTEVAQIAAFAQELGLDAGGLDVLRDRRTGQLFIVDANKTDMGPPLALPLEDKLRATQMMSEALEDYLFTERALQQPMHVETEVAQPAMPGALTEAPA